MAFSIPATCYYRSAAVTHYTDVLPSFCCVGTEIQATHNNSVFSKIPPISNGLLLLSFTKRREIIHVFNHTVFRTKLSLILLAARLCLKCKVLYVNFSFHFSCSITVLSVNLCYCTVVQQYV